MFNMLVQSHIILDRFCAGAKNIQDRASVQTHIGTVISARFL